jgi:PAS domain S-box-containing protein
MPRKPLILALLIIALHVCEALTLGTSTLGSFVANGLELAACGFAAAMAFGAYRRGRGLSRPFWLMLAAGLSMWGLANVGWTYYEVVIHTEPPTTSAVRFLFGLEAVLIAMVMFLDQGKDSPRIDVESALDFLQIGIVFFFIYVEFYHLPAHRLDMHHAMLREMRVENLEDALLTGLAAYQTWRARKPHIRKLYGGLTLYLVCLTVFAAAAQYLQNTYPAPTGTLRDLLWTAPFLYAALWAALWKPEAGEETSQQLRRKTMSELMITNGTLALAPLIILFQVSRMDTEWRVLRFSLLGVSIVCYAARLGMSQFREARSADAVRTHALAMESTADGMAILDNNATHIYANSAFAKMLGFEHPEEVLGKSWRQVYDPRDTALLEELLRQSVQKTGRWSGQISLHRRDNTTLPVEMAITTMAQGGVVCIARDMSERLKAEHARAEAEIKYRTLVEQVAAISYIAELGVTGQWYYVSPQIEAILGYSTEEWLADSPNWMRHILPEDHHVIHEAERSCLRGLPFQAEYRIKRKDGLTIWVSDNAVVVRGSDSHQVMEGLIVDITERKQLENQLQQSHRMEAVGRLAGGIAHDFNNLLTIINGYAEMAARRPTISRELTADVQQISNASERAAVLVRQLLAFSRKQVLQPKPLDLNAIVEGLEKLLSRLMGKDIVMATHCCENIGTVKADPSQIEQVIMNLVVNARDAMPDGGRLTIETANVELDANYARDHASVKPGPYVMLAVSDTGIGMDQKTQAHIFEPFYTTKGGSRGTGLGLSTVYGIVKQSGGYIWVYSEPGKGTSFKVYLPRVEEPQEIPSTRREEDAAHTGTETILLVEDEAAVRELARSILVGQGYSVIAVDSATEAEQIAVRGSREIHLLLTDVVMAGVSGRELARRITARRPKTRVLFMSGYTDSVIASGGVLAPGVAFLQKPFTPRALTQKVREVLDRAVPVG